MKPSVLPIALAGLCLSFVNPVNAQMPDEPAVPKLLRVEREQIKEGREAAHTKSEEAWPRIFRKGNVTSTYYIGMTAETGPPEAWFLEPYDSFGGMEKARTEIQRSAVMKPELEAANVEDGDLRTGSRSLLAIFRADLSYRAPEAISGLAKCRYMGVSVLHIKYGHDADLAQAAKLLIDGDEKSNSDQPALTYQVISGGSAGTYLIFSPMDSLARMDAGPARTAAARQAMGEKNRQRFDGLAVEMVQSSESLLFSFEPRMSYVSKEFAAVDPEFWEPKPEPTAKPRPMRKH